MPIVLLPEVVRSLADLARRLAGWERLAPLEEQILRRARGAFLVRWFGPGIPERRLGLLIAIANVEELKARLDLARRSMPGRASELNLTAPLATLAGTMAGMAMSLSGAFLIADHLHRIYALVEDTWKAVIGKIVFALAGVWTMPAWGPGLTLALGLPLLSALALGATLGGDRRVGAVHGLLGDLAAMIDAALAFWDQVTGPVGRIRNPLLRAIMDTLNRLAGLYAQALGFVAFVVAKVLPLVPWLLEQFRAAKALGQSVLAAAADAASGIMEALGAPFGATGSQATLSGILDAALGILTRLLDAAMALPAKLLESMTFLIEGTLTELGHAAEAVGRVLSAWTEGLTSRIEDAFKATPVGQLLERLKEIKAMKAGLLDAWAHRARPPEPRAGAGSASGGGLGEAERRLRGLPARIGSRLLGVGDIREAVADLISAARALRIPSMPPIAVPAFPPLPTLPDAPALQSRIGAPAPVDFGGEAARLLAEAERAQAARRLPAALRRRPRSVFAADLEANPLPPPPDAAQLALRDAIYLAVGRFLPAALRLHAPALREAFDALDRRIYEVEPTAGPVPAYPELDLPDSGLLRPVVETLIIRSRGGDAPDLRAFRNMVVEAMQAQSYRAPDTA